MMMMKVLVLLSTEDSMARGSLWESGGMIDSSVLTGSVAGPGQARPVVFTFCKAGLLSVVAWVDVLRSTRCLLCV